MLLATTTRPDGIPTSGAGEPRLSAPGKGLGLLSEYWFFVLFCKSEIKKIWIFKFKVKSFSKSKEAQVQGGLTQGKGLCGTGIQLWYQMAMSEVLPFGGYPLSTWRLGAILCFN